MSPPRVPPDKAISGGAESDDQSQAKSIGQTDTSGDTDEWKEMHAYYLDDAKERIGHAKTVLLLWVAALLTTWLSGIEQSRHDVQEFVTAQAAYDRSLAEARERERRQEALAPREPGRKPKEKSKPAMDQSQALPGDSEQAKHRKELSKERATQAVNFELFGVKVPIPPLVAASVWLGLLCCMFLKLLSERWWVFRSLGRALRIERKHLMLRGRERIATAPWWLAPLPRSNGSHHISRDDFLAALDWHSRPLYRHILPGLSFFALAFVAGAVFYANQQLLKYSSTLESFSGQSFPVWQIQVATWAPLILIGVCLVLIGKWTSAFEMPDYFSGEPRSRVISRRDVLLMGVFLAVGGAAFLLNRKSVLVRTVRRETRRRGRDYGRLTAKLDRVRNRRLTPIPKVKPLSLYKNDRAPVGHVSNLAGAFRFPLTPKQYSFVEPGAVKELFGEKSGNRVALREVSWGFELKAMEALQQNKTGLACDILFAAIRHDLLFLKSEPRKPNYRLYDFLAGLSVRSKTDHFSSMRQLLEDSSALPAFQYRIKTWEDLNSRWRRRWTGPNRVWITSIANTKKGKKEKEDFRAESEKKRLRLPM